MTRVLVSGVFDIIHLGHLYYLEQAKKLGDELIVAVASDITAKAEEKEPIIPEQLRMEIVSALKPVDQVVLYDSENLYKIIEDLQPDIIALGYDQKYDPVRLKKELRKRRLKAKIKRLKRHPNTLLGNGQILHTIVSRQWS